MLAFRIRGNLRTWLVSLALSLPLVLASCASTLHERDDAGGGDDDDTSFIDAAVHPDAPPGTPDAAIPPGTPDAAIPPGTPDAAPPLPPDAMVPTGPFCTANSQCNQSAHECCWLWLGSQGNCVYGDELPILNCVPADPPDAGM
jgi:hypothetical protein